MVSIRSAKGRGQRPYPIDGHKVWKQKTNAGKWTGGGGVWSKI